MLFARRNGNQSERRNATPKLPDNGNHGQILESDMSGLIHVFVVGGGVLPIRKMVMVVMHCLKIACLHWLGPLPN